MTRKFGLPLILVAALLASSVAWAEDGTAGSTYLDVFAIGVGAGPSAMAAYTAAPGDLWSLTYNPAGLANVDRLKLGVSHFLGNDIRRSRIPEETTLRFCLQHSAFLLQSPPMFCSRCRHHYPEVGNGKTRILYKLKMLVKNILPVVIKSYNERTANRQSIGLDLADILEEIPLVILALPGLL